MESRGRVAITVPDGLWARMPPMIRVNGLPLHTVASKRDGETHTWELTEAQLRRI